MKNMERLEDIFREALYLMGEDPKREGLLDTPKRVAKAWKEHFEGYAKDPSEILSTAFVDGACDEMVVVKDIEFVSTCEHHLERIIGIAHVAYIPDGKVVGLSKIARLVDCFAKRLQIQEKMTQQISKALEDNLKPKGVGVIIEAKHQCMSCRGVKKLHSTMITSSMLGAFRNELEVRMEFLSLLKK